MAESLVEGWTGPLDFTLTANGVAIDGTGASVALVLASRNGGIVPMAGKVAWLVQASGTVRVQPAAADLKADQSPYDARFKVTDSGGKVTFYPNGPPDVWTVRR